MRKVLDTKIKVFDAVFLGLVTWLLISSFVAAMLFNVNTDVNWILIKDLSYIIVFVLILPFLLVSKVDSKILLSLGLFSFFLSINFILSPANSLAKFASVRQVISFALMFLIGYVLVKSKKSYQKLIKYFVLLSLLVVLFGFFERFSSLWLHLSVVNYFKYKNIGIYSNGYPVFFTEPIPVFLKSILGDTRLIRMVSTILDPINLGHTLVLAVSFLVIKTKRILKPNYIRLGCILLFSLGVVLTFSKGAIIHLFLVILLLLFPRLWKYIVWVFILIFVSFLYLKQFHAGLQIHVDGLLSSFSSVTVLGYGLGSTGNYATMFGSSSMNVVTGIMDTFVGAILGQLGLVGLSLWLFVMYTMVYKLPKYGSLKAVLIVQIFVAFFSENSFNLLSIAFLFLFIGGYYGSIRHEKLNLVDTE